MTPRLSGPFAVAAFLAALWAFFLGRRLLLRRLQPAAAGESWRGLAAELVRGVRPLELVLLSLYLATRHLRLEPRLDRLAGWILLVVVAYRLTVMAEAAALFTVRRALAGDEGDPSRREASRALQTALRVVVWVGAALFVLSNLGFNVSSMIAGLGIGGIAVALGAQAVLGDLFAAVALYLDRAVLVGDPIRLGDAAGVVERIGLKTTRLRAPSGELLVIPNSLLASSRLQNFRGLSERRAVVNFSLPAAAPPEVLRRLPERARAIAGRLPAVRFEGAHLVAVRGASLDFEAAFTVRGPELELYKDRVQSFLLELLEALRADGVALS